MRHLQSCFFLLVAFFLLLAGEGLAQAHVSSSPNMWPNLDSLIKVTNQPIDDTGKVKAYHMLSASVAGTDPAKAVIYGKKGAALGRQLRYTKGLANCYFNVAYASNLSGNIRSAVLYMDSAIALYKEMDKKLLLGVCYYNRAGYNVKLGRLKEALEDCHITFNYAQELNKTSLIREVYNTIGDIKYLQNNYAQSGVYYQKALEMNEKQGDSVTMTILLNKIGKVHASEMHYDAAITTYEKAIALSNRIKYENELPVSYTNLAIAWLKKGYIKKAEQSARKSVEYARKKNNKSQLAEAQATLSNIYLNRDSTQMAMQTAKESYAAADSANTAETRRQSALVMAQSFYQAGKYKEAYDYLSISVAMTDSIAKDMYNDEIAEMQTSFSVNEKDREIRLLEKDRQLQQQKLRQQRLLLIGAGAVAVLLLGGVWLFVSRNRLKHKMKELELRSQIAADLHDEVGSSLSSIHMLSEMATQSDNQVMQKDLLSRMTTNVKETMEKMGDLVWTIKPEEGKGTNLKQRIERFAYEICGTKNIDLSVDLDGLDVMDLGMEQRKSIYLIFKEALNNAVKYSGTAKIFIKASGSQHMLTMIVRDEGQGFDTNMVKKGNGLDNIQARAASVGGDLTITTEQGKGTEIKVTMPFSK